MAKADYLFQVTILHDSGETVIINVDATAEDSAVQARQSAIRLVQDNLDKYQLPGRRSLSIAAVEAQRT